MNFKGTNLMVFQNSEISIYYVTIPILKIIFEPLHFENSFSLSSLKKWSPLPFTDMWETKENSRRRCVKSPVWYCRLFRSAEWSVTEWIKQVRSELGCWRAVYWKLWGHCHWQLCSICHTYYPLSQTEWCSYHPDSPQFFIMEQHRTMSFPIGKC